MQVRICAWFPPKRFAAITIGRTIIVRKDFMDKYGQRDRWIYLLNHEKIHQAQMDELGVLKFYIMYLAYFIRNLVRLRNWMEAYRAIPFELEAYKWEKRTDYLFTREPFAWKKETPAS